MKAITKNEIESILNKIQNIGDDGVYLYIQDPIPYQTAFVHKSYFHEIESEIAYDNNSENNTTNFIPTSSNEVLDYLGDGFIGAVVGKYLVDRFENEQEGFLTKTRTRLVRSSALYRFARFLGLGQYLLLSQQVERLTHLGPNKGRNNPRFYEDCFEAFVGAIIQDFGDEHGYRYAKRFLVSIIEHIVDFADIILNNENHKDILQRFFQSKSCPDDETKKWPNPIYIDIGQSGPFHMRTFVKGVFIGKNLLQQLPLHIQQSSIKYHNDQLNSNDNSYKIVQSIINYSDTNGVWLIGLGSANKKIAAEQQCSSIALCCLSVNENF